MLKDYGMYQGYNVEGTVSGTAQADLKVTPEAMPKATMPPMHEGCAMPMNINSCNAMPGVICPPVYECPQERCIHREIVHEVPHVMPINTKIINRHIYKHTYTPCYSCCEENEVCNVVESCNPCCSPRC